METAPLILDFGLVLLLAAACGWGARRIGLPAVVGYLAAGLAVSPFTPGYVADREQILLLADIGVVILLFEVGIEVDVGRIRREQRALLWLAPVQILATTALAGGVLLAVGLAPYAAALVGLAIAMSSSVVVVNVTRSRRRTTDRPTEEGLLGWSVLQDVTGVGLAAALLAAGGTGERSLPVALGGMAAFFALAVVFARLLPRALGRLRSEHDLFLIVSVAAGLLLAGVGAVAFGIPTALAAFVAGLAISDRAETAEARRRILPFRDVFAVLFFVAVGSLLDPARLGAALPFTALLLALVLVTKVALVWLLARLGRLRARPLQLAVGLGQLGEFGYVLAGVGLAAGSVTDTQFTGVLAAIVVTIAASAVLARSVGRVPGVVPASLPPAA